MTSRPEAARGYSAQGQPEAALQLFQEAGERDPGAYSLFLDLGKAALALDRGRLAAQAFERAKAREATLKLRPSGDRESGA